MLKYYFGYKSTLGLIFAILWVEDNGVPVGGEVKTVAGNRHEISHKEFSHADRTILKEKYPYKEPSED